MSRIPKPRRKVQQWVITGLSERAPVQGGYQKHGPPGGEALNKREKNELQKLRAQARREGRNPDLVMLPPPKLRRAPKLREPDAILLGPALPTMALPPAEIMDAAQLGRACNAVARGDGAVTLLPGLAHRARELVLELAPRDLTKVLKAFSRQRYEDADLGALLLRQALTRLAYFDAQDLVVLLSSLVRTELKEELMPVAEELRERCPELRGATVLSSACSAAAWLPEPDLRTHRTHPDAVGPMRWRTPLGQVRRLWTPGTGPRGDDPHRRPHVRLREGAEQIPAASVFPLRFAFDLLAPSEVPLGPPALAMAVEMDFNFEQVEKLASLSYQQAGSMKRGSYVMMRGRPCRIVEAAHSAPSKHGHAKVHMVGLDLFTGKKYEEIHQAGQNVEVPVVTKTEYLLVNLNEETGEVSLLQDNGELKVDLNLPAHRHKTSEDDVKVEADIMKAFSSDRFVVTVVVMAACGEEKIVGCSASD
ncbi:Eukaryotic translation initiation factor 5A-4 (eIF-5A-4) (eIF-4D) [Durusdinium trenchii]|uniref:Eukaryotic translation initiation factor 5A-4 (eIF-5A-4) (eIF-4D) n=1 Tax=Durusdinium trenchii TaxID=1381693 RepID=A0ABP0N0A1_9DINO